MPNNRYRDSMTKDAVISNERSDALSPHNEGPIAPLKKDGPAEVFVLSHFHNVYTALNDHHGNPGSWAGSVFCKKKPGSKISRDHKAVGQRRHESCGV